MDNCRIQSNPHRYLKTHIAAVVGKDDPLCRSDGVLSLAMGSRRYSVLALLPVRQRRVFASVGIEQYHEHQQKGTVNRIYDLNGSYTIADSLKMLEANR